MRLDSIMTNRARSMETTNLPPSPAFNSVVDPMISSQDWMSYEEYYDVPTQNPPHSFIPWEHLPPEILMNIFSYLDVDDKENVEKTCHSWMQTCHVPSLWSEMIFYFSGIDSVDVLTKAYRLIENKGHFLRTLTIKIGLPSLTQAWMMSQCIQHLLEFIARNPNSDNIEHFSLKNLNFSNEWRFFTLSKNSILQALNNFLFRQKSLKSIDFTASRFNVPDGMRILRTLKRSLCRYTIQRIELKDFFRKNYSAIHGARFSIILYSSMLALQELGVDARHVDDKMLRRLTEKSACRRRLQHLKIFFQTDKIPRSFISKQSWLEAREACPKLRVSIHVCGWLPKGCSTRLWADSMPLSQCIILWAPNVRRKWIPNEDLSFLIRDLGARYSTMLETFRLDSRTKSDMEVDSAILYMVSRCRYLGNLHIAMDNTLVNNRHSITNITCQRSFKVNVSVGRRNLRQGTH